MRQGITAGAALAGAITVARWLVLPGANSIDNAAPPAAVEARRSVAAVDSPVIATTTVAPVAPNTEAVDDEPADLGSEFLVALNDVRVGVGARPLVRDPALDELAAQWARRMAVEDHLRHTELIYTVVAADEWRAAGENIGFGPTVERVVAAFVASPGHRTNIVDENYSALGVGVVVVDEVIWTAHLFAG